MAEPVAHPAGNLSCFFRADSNLGRVAVTVLMCHNIQNKQCSSCFFVFLLLYLVIHRSLRSVTPKRVAPTRREN